MRVQHYLDCMWARGAAVNIPKVVGDGLQPALRRELMTTLCKTIVQRVPLFVDGGDDFVASLAERVTFQCFPSGEWIVRTSSL